MYTNSKFENPRIDLEQTQKDAKELGLFDDGNTTRGQEQSVDTTVPEWISYKRTGRPLTKPGRISYGIQTTDRNVTRKYYDLYLLVEQFFFIFCYLSSITYLLFLSSRLMQKSILVANTIISVCKSSTRNNNNWVFFAIKIYANNNCNYL